MSEIRQISGPIVAVNSGLPLIFRIIKFGRKKLETSVNNPSIVQREVYSDILNRSGVTHRQTDKQTFRQQRPCL